MTDAPRSPAQSFGLIALEILLRAKANRMERGDINRLMLAALTHVGEHAALRAAVVDFVTGCAVNPVTAALRFDAALSVWVETLPREDGQAGAAQEQGLFEWQKRVDING